jgi:hemoglobin-like flavoprotein
MDIRDSLEHILQNKDIFGTKFYELFFGRCPEARQYFAATDLFSQELQLTMALTVMERFRAKRYPAMAAYLKYLGHKHHRRDIPTELYPKFGDALLTTLEQFHGADWSETLAGEWRDAIECTTQVMLTGYQAPVYV